MSDIELECIQSLILCLESIDVNKQIDQDLNKLQCVLLNPKNCTKMF